MFYIIYLSKIDKNKLNTIQTRTGSTRLPKNNNLVFDII